MLTHLLRRISRPIHVLNIAVTAAMSPVLSWNAFGQTPPPAEQPALIRQPNQMPQGDIDLTTYLGTIGGNGIAFGVLGGYRFDRNAFIPHLNNSVSAEGGVMYGTSCWGNSCYSLSGHVRWDFHVHRLWTAYGAGGLTLGNASVFSKNDKDEVESHIAPDFKVGAFWRANSDIIVRMEFVPFLFAHRVGLTWMI